MATLKDIAAELGISVTQVSRALNGHSDVNERTRERVEAAARSLNYQPNVLARKLATGRSGIVGLVISHYPKLVQDSHFIEMVAGLSAQFSGRGMQFVLHIAPENEDILSVYAKLITSGTFDGFVLSDCAVNDARIAYLSAAGVPFVVHGRAGDNPQYPYFDIDNVRLGQDHTHYLLEQGHRRIAAILGRETGAYTQARADGHRRAMQAAGLNPTIGWQLYGPMDESHGLVSTIRLMSQTTEPKPTAIICGNVLIANGVYQGLASLGLQIPADVSVIAHDDELPQLHASVFFPSLTVTKAPLRDSWLPLADCLVGALEGRPLASIQQVAEHLFIQGHSVLAPAE